MPEQVQYRTKLTQSGIFLVRYRTKNSGCRNADDGVSFLDANAQLYIICACINQFGESTSKPYSLCTVFYLLFLPSTRRSGPGWKIKWIINRISYSNKDKCRLHRMFPILCNNLLTFNHIAVCSLSRTVSHNLPGTSFYCLFMKTICYLSSKIF
jgi:hypothetical protein